MILAAIQTSYSATTQGHRHVAGPTHSDEPSSKDEASTKPVQEADSTDQQRLLELKSRDREVRAHEQAHLSAAGGFAKSGVSYTYERGPDQRMYAVGGEVQVDTSAVVNDPVATLRKAQVIRRAALAPVNPSAQDRRVAAEATQMEAKARTEIAAQNKVENSTQTDGDAESAQTSKSDTAVTCPACGGAHATSAHDGITAYTASQTSITNEIIAST